MSGKSQHIKLEELFLDLKNYRTTPQINEKSAIEAMISIKPDRFFAVLISILNDGYLPTENIIVTQSDTQLTVREGNRRIAALKIIHGFYTPTQLSTPIPEDIVRRIQTIDTEWKASNLEVPCLVFQPAEEKIVKKIVSLTHGKGEKAQRDDWTSVATARHNKNENQVTELGLDLLEKYLNHGSNINNSQKQQWAGDYPLTVLDETLNKLPIKLGLKEKTELVNKYPHIPQKENIERLLFEIGIKNFGFPQLRDKSEDILEKFFNLRTPEQIPENPTSGSSNSGSSNSGSSTSGSSTSGSSNSTPNGVKSKPINTQTHVRQLLKQLQPKGTSSAKILMVRDEMRSLTISKHPLAFCFLLRSCFEISAKAYCNNNKVLQFDTKTQKELTLKQMLNNVCSDIISKDRSKKNALQGAQTELNSTSKCYQ